MKGALCRPLWGVTKDVQPINCFGRVRMDPITNCGGK